MPDFDYDQLTYTLGQFTHLLGETIETIEVNDNKTELLLTLDNNCKYKMWHEPDCCESVYIEDIAGELADLLGSPITLAEEATNVTDPPLPKGDESYTWTFYRLGTAKGVVTIRWYGTSNGYYSESVSFARVKA